MKTTASDELVSRDSDLLALHMLDCQRARSRFFKLQSTLELMHTVVSPRIVTSFALVAVTCGVGVLAFA